MSVDYLSVLVNTSFGGFMMCLCYVIVAVFVHSVLRYLC